jgi:hypothetical protein
LPDNVRGGQMYGQGGMPPRYGAQPRKLNFWFLANYLCNKNREVMRKFFLINVYLSFVT